MLQVLLLLGFFLLGQGYRNVRLTQKSLFTRRRIEMASGLHGENFKFMSILKVTDAY